MALPDRVSRKIMASAVLRGNTATTRELFNQLPQPARCGTLTQYLMYKAALLDRDQSLGKRAARRQVLNIER